MTDHDLDARHAVEACITRHNLGRDRRDAAMLVSVYHPDATVDFGPSMPAEVWIERICGSSATLASYHRTANVVVKVDGDLARSESACVAHVLLPEVHVQRFLLGRYLDRHSDRGEGWRIARRCFVLDHVIDLPLSDETLAAPLIGPAVARRICERRELPEIAATSALFTAERAADRGDEAGLLAWVDPVVARDRIVSGGATFRINEAVHAQRTAEGVRLTSRALTIHSDGRSGGGYGIDVARQMDLVAPRGKEWRIIARDVDERWSGVCPAATIDLTFERGRPDRLDPSYAFWR